MNVDTSTISATQRNKVDEAVKQWRDSVTALDGYNRFLNFKPNKTSTIEFTQHSAAEVYRIIASKKPTYTMGTVDLSTPSTKPAVVIDGRGGVWIWANNSSMS